MNGDYQTAARMAVKFAAVPLPDLESRTVLDVGCDHGAWCWRALELGASRVLGLDRGRDVPGEGFVNLAERNRSRGMSGAEFREFELGRQWHEFGRHDVVLLLNVYHHAFQAAGDHRALWHWLWRHTGEVLVWEAPLTKADPVAAQHVAHRYDADEIRAAAEHYFDIEVVGPGWVPTREVWRCTPRQVAPIEYAGRAVAGAGGASKAFAHDNGRRIAEIELATGVRAMPGSMNVQLDQPFDWDRGYFRARILDVKDRNVGLEGEWAPRWARFYPVRWNGLGCMAFRFEGESYAPEFVELIAARRLRDGGESGVLAQ